MLQNKSVLIFLWLLIFAFIGFLFLRNDDVRENDAVLKSTQLLKTYYKDFFDRTEYKIEKNVLDFGNDPRDRKVLDRFKKNRFFLDSLSKLNKLEWSILLGQLVQHPNDSTYPIYLKDSLLYSYLKTDSKSIFSIHQNLLHHYYYRELENDRYKVGGFHGSHFGNYLRIGVIDSTFHLTASSLTYTNFILEPHFDKPKYYSTNFIFNKDSVIRFQTITKTFMNGKKIERTKRYEITPTNGKILSPLSYKEIKK